VAIVIFINSEAGEKQSYKADLDVESIAREITK
jgi:hypothetical protein